MLRDSTDAVLVGPDAACPTLCCATSLAALLRTSVDTLGKTCLRGTCFRSCYRSETEIVHMETAPKRHHLSAYVWRACHATAALHHKLLSGWCSRWHCDKSDHEDRRVANKAYGNTLYGGATTSCRGSRLQNGSRSELDPDQNASPWLSDKFGR